LSARVYGFVSRNGYRCVDVLLNSMNTTENVFWSPRANSYVLCEPGMQSAKLGDVPHLPDGTAVDLVSVNGIGEVRWQAMGWQLESMLERPPYPGSDGEEILAAARHFGLSYKGKKL
jgi:hypothetical protein